MRRTITIDPVFARGAKHKTFSVSRKLEKATRHPEAKIYHALWDELHTKGDPTPEWFSAWAARLPRVECPCRSFLKAHLPTNPPRYDDWFPWTVELHNAVNAKLGKPLVTIEEASQIWNR